MKQSEWLAESPINDVIHIDDPERAWTCYFDHTGKSRSALITVEAGDRDEAIQKGWEELSTEWTTHPERWSLLEVSQATPLKPEDEA